MSRGYYDDGAAALTRARERVASVAVAADWISVTDASERAGVSIHTIRNAVVRGDVLGTRSMDTGYSDRVELESLLRWARRLRLVF